MGVEAAPDMWWFGANSGSHRSSNLLWIGCVITVSVSSFILLRKLVLYMTWGNFVDGKYIPSLHQWRPTNLAGPQCCNLCESIVYGIRSYVVTCDICGMFAHARCAAHIRDLESCACRTAAIPMKDSDSCSSFEELASKKHYHHWIKGNIEPAVDTCSVCGLFCGSVLSLSGRKCSWCHIHVHEKCFRENYGDCNSAMNECDLGAHRKLILPPSSILMKYPHYHGKTPSSGRRIRYAVHKVAKTAVNKMSQMRLRRSTVDMDSNSIEPSKCAFASSKESIVETNKSTTNRTVNDGVSTPRKVIVSSESSGIDNSNVEEFDRQDLNLPFIISPPSDSTPLLVFINSRSGGQMGLTVLRKLRSRLNPLQVYDLSHDGPLDVLRQFVTVPHLRILVCGGDGTVGWVLGALDELHLERNPPVAILPLGTGNDLARVVGWGGGFSTKGIDKLLTEVEEAHISLLDRWKVDLDGHRRGIMNNYLGVGVDAQVALDFHEQRERSPSLFMSQFVNKLWYSRFGAKNALMRTYSGLPNKLILECDGQIIDIPEGAEGIILSNISSFGGGSTLWHDESDGEESDEEDIVMKSFSRSRSMIRKSRPSGFAPSSHQDGLLDVVAVYGAFHLGQLQVGLSRAVRLTQCKVVRMTMKENLPVQIDGEPWRQKAPCTVEVQFHRQVFMLSRTVEEGDLVTKKVGEVLDWAEMSGVITSSQRDILLAEVSKRVKFKNRQQYYWLSEMRKKNN